MLVLISTICAFAVAAWEVGIVPVAVIGGFGLLCGIATLPWRQQLSNMPEVDYLCMWAVAWFFLLLYSAAAGMRIYFEHWTDYVLRRRYERSIAKER